MDMTTNTTNVTIDNMSDFLNGTAGGLTCFGVMNMPELDEYPYGPNFNWSALAPVGEATTTSAGASATGMGSATGAGSSTAASPSATSPAQQITWSSLASIPCTLLLAVGVLGLF